MTEGTRGARMDEMMALLKETTESHGKNLQDLMQKISTLGQRWTRCPSSSNLGRTHGFPYSWDTGREHSQCRPTSIILGGLITVSPLQWNRSFGMVVSHRAILFASTDTDNLEIIDGVIPYGRKGPSMVSMDEGKWGDFKLRRIRKGTDHQIWAFSFWRSHGFVDKALPKFFDWVVPNAI